MIEQKEFDLHFLTKQGLHDSILETFFIDYTKKSVVLNISNFSETDEGKLVVELQEVKTIEIDKNDDLKNKEIILSFSVDMEKKEINIYTASDTNYKIVFIKSSISIAK